MLPQLFIYLVLLLAFCGGDESACLGCGTNCNKRFPNCQTNPRLCPRIACIPQLNKSPRCNEQNNEVIDSCINGGCGWRNCSQLGDPMLCVNPIKCVQGCSCKRGYYRLEDGTCVPESQCPPKKCKGPNEHFDCGSACDNVCGRPEYKYNCPIKNIKCNPMCYCNDGFARNDHGICIPVSDCPQKCKGPNEYFDCGSACDNVCGRPENKYNCPIKNIKCNPKCYCKDGFARNIYGICIPVNQCPPTQQKSFSELLESRCVSKGITFVPIAGKTREGRPLYKIGDLQCYVIRNVIMYSNDGGRNFSPISIDKLLKLVED